MHNWQEVKESRYMCLVCGALFGGESATEVGNHIFDEHGGAGSYTAISVVVGYECSTCGLTNDTPEPAGTDHNWQENRTGPTCTGDGYVVYTCSNCGDSYTETLAATGHTEGEFVYNDLTEKTDGNAWYFDAVYAASDLGLIAGYDDGTFGLGKSINRCEAAAMLDAAL